MCGIAGTFGHPRREVVERMLEAIAHRGPDGGGLYESADGAIIMGARRLAIIDIEGGRQPMGNEDASVWAVYNGEIYNHQELREELLTAGHHFRSTCDTEVLVHLYEESGADLASRLNGEFAFAIADAARGILLLARDRLGIRPLYVTELDGSLHFASELKALLQVPGAPRRVDPEALHQYLALRYAPGERSMIRGIERVPAGEIWVRSRGQATRRRFWELPASVVPRSAPEAVDAVDQYLRDAVRMRLMSDVPLGMYLSSGVDSCLMLALMAKGASQPVRTFSIGFGLELDETREAAEIASAFGARHTEIILPRDSYQLLPDVARAVDEPIGDAIILPTSVLCREASRHVKVVLTGEGADEVFGGYVHHVALPWLSRIRASLPGPLLHLGRHALGLLPSRAVDALFPYPERLGAEGRQRLLRHLDPAAVGTSYLDLVSVFDEAERVRLLVAEIQNGGSWRGRFEDALADRHDGRGPLGRLIDLDARTWLPDYTLLKQDRLTMRSSLEGRVPYLDHRLVELAMTLPDSLRLKGLTPKWLLRQVARRHLPTEAAFRKKKAFYLPVARFFGAGFSEMVRDTLAEDSVRRDGFFRPEALGPIIDAGLRDELLPGKRLMVLLVFTLWCRAHGATP